MVVRAGTVVPGPLTSLVPRTPVAALALLRTALTRRPAGRLRGRPLLNRTQVRAMVAYPEGALSVSFLLLSAATALQAAILRTLVRT